LQVQLKTRQSAGKNTDKLSNKVKTLEKQIASRQNDYDKSTQKFRVEIDQLKERLQTVTNMNFALQKKLASSKRKADLYDNVIARCVQLENTNQSLLRLVNQADLPESDRLKATTPTAFTPSGLSTSQVEQSGR
jgi:predicted RNase H-like nuclease (RuvC/YqgF family)